MVLLEIYVKFQGTYFTDKCYPQTCDAGYYFFNTSNECIACPSGTYKESSGLDLCSPCPALKANEIFVSKEGAPSYEYACLYACANGYTRDDINR